MTLLQNFRYALRTLAKQPGFTGTAVLTLALGIGANTAIFSAVYTVLMRPLPVEDLHRMLVVQSDAPGLNLRRFPMTPASAVSLNKREDLFEAVGGYMSVGLTLTGLGEPQLIRGARTAGEFFKTLRASPILGRLYGADASEPGRHYIAVVSYGFWKRVGGGAPDFVGRKILLDEQPHEIVAVMPPDFGYPRTAEVWTPMASNDPAYQPASVLVTLARLQPGVTAVRADAGLRAHASAWQAPKGWGLTIVTMPFLEYLAGQLRSVLLVLMGAVCFVLLIACANVASLQLVRATVRRKEMAVRAAIGAGRWTLIRQSLAESLILAAAGGALGLLIGSFVIDALRIWQPENLPQLSNVQLNNTALLFTAAISILAGLGFGVIPALRGAKVDVNQALRSNSRTSSGQKKHHRMLSGFAAVQIAVAFILLTGSALMVRSFGELIEAGSGFNTDRLVSMRFNLPTGRYRQTSSLASFYNDLQNRLKNLPAIETAGIVNDLPLANTVASSPFQIVHRPTRPDEPQPHAERKYVGGEYLRLMGIRLLKGRLFEPSDLSPSNPVVLIDAQLAREYFGHEDPVGKQISQGLIATVIGVVTSVSQKEVGGPPKATIYYSIEQYPRNPATLVLRTSLDANAAAALVRGIVSQIDPNAPVSEVRTIQQLIDDSLGARRLAMYVLSAFAALSLTVALLGIYGVLSYTTRERTQEIGIRMALGAHRQDVIRLVLRRGSWLAAAGLTAGVAGSLLLTRFLAALLYGVSPRDPAAIAGSALLLGVAALLASYLPARRAAKLDPMVALRHE